MEEGSGEDDAIVFTLGAGEQLGGKGGGDGVFPEFTLVDGVAFLGRREGAGAAGGDGNLVDLLEAELGDGVVEVADGGTEAEEGTIAELDDVGGEGGVVGDEVDDFLAGHVGLAEQGEQLGQDLRRGGQAIDAVDVGVEVVHRVISPGSPAARTRTWPVAMSSAQERLRLPPTCSPRMRRLCLWRRVVRAS